MCWIPLPFVAVAAIYDLRTREVPDWVPAALLAWAVAATALGLNGVSWTALVCGAGVGLLIGWPLFVAGAFGGGDVKLVAALGAALGPVALLAVLFWAAIAGGLLAIVARWRGERTFAYVPAIALGLLIYTVRLELFTRAAG